MTTSLSAIAGTAVEILPKHVQKISEELSIEQHKIAATLELILEDCTIPFIARYRKEKTGNLDEVQIRDIRDRYEYFVQLDERRAAVIRSIEEQGKMTAELRAEIDGCETKTRLEDLYLPYKPKKRTRGQVAKERGLEPLAASLMSRESPFAGSLDEAFEAAVALHEELKSADDVRKGVKDIIAESVSESADLRQDLRTWIFQNAVFRSVVREEFAEKKTKYADYYDFQEQVASIPPHRLMALRRGEKEGILRVQVSYDPEPPLQMIEGRVTGSVQQKELKDFLEECAKEAFDRILSTSTETDIRLEAKNKAEEDAIKVFSKNMRKLLLLPPIPSKVVMGVDPGIRTGSKVVVVDETGKLLEYDTIYPVLDHLEHAKNKTAVERLIALIGKHNVACISVGNGTGSREVADLIDHALQAHGLEDRVQVMIVNESGASVYSASDVAREEFPDLDITIRGSVSIARRLQDPLAELVKIDPKSIGVGQYQHDVNQVKLKKSLGEVVESCVNYVGVNLNTASPSLLSYVAGIGPGLARSIVETRQEKGRFVNRSDLMKVPGFGPKAFQQSAGFLRIAEAPNPLDGTAVHPESYPIVEQMAEKLGCTVKELVGNKELVAQLKLSEFVTDTVGELTLKDIIAELQKPGRDPRKEGASQKYSRIVRKISDLKEGQILDGTVTNVTNFGAFVDIGVHQDGLVHVSELSTDFVQDASEAISVGDKVKVMVIGVDLERKRISLSRKACLTGAAGNTSKAANPGKEQGSHERRRPSPRRAGASSGQSGKSGRPRGNPLSSTDRGARKSEEPSKPASMADLLAKFNSNKV